MISAYSVIAVPREDTACELHRSRKLFSSFIILCFFMALLLDPARVLQLSCVHGSDGVFNEMAAERFQIV